METVIKLIIKKDFNKLDDILRDINNDNHIINLIYFLLGNINNNFFCDDNFLIIFNLILRHNNNFLKSNDFDNILKKLNSEGLSKSVKLLENNKNLEHSQSFLLRFLDLCKQGGTGLKRLLDNDVCLEITFPKLIQKITDVMKPLSDIDYINTLKLDNKALEKKNIDIDTYQNIQSVEMKNRLLEIINFFGINLLRFMNIRIITNIDFIHYTYNNKVKYYIECIEYINKTVESYNKIFKLYLHFKEEVDNISYIILKDNKENVSDKIYDKYYNNLSEALDDFMKN